jgi:hypothetical protein
MKESSLNISLQKCHSKQNVPSSPSGEDERWRLISGTWRFFAALRSTLNDRIRCIVLSNREIVSDNNSSERHCEPACRQTGTQDEAACLPQAGLLIAFRDSTRDCFVAKFHFVHFAPRNDGNYEDLLKWN